MTANARKKTTPTPTLTQDDVDKFVSTHARIKELEPVLADLNTRIKGALKAGAPCPDAGPFLLVLTPQERMEHSYKDILEVVLASLPTDHPARKEATEMASESQTVYCLNIKPNAKVLGGLKSVK
jgi:hypothetical protein